MVDKNVTFIDPGKLRVRVYNFDKRQLEFSTDGVLYYCYKDFSNFEQFAKDIYSVYRKYKYIFEKDKK